MAFLDALDDLAGDLSEKLDRQKMKADIDRQGRVAMAPAAAAVDLPQRINGDRVLSATAASPPASRCRARLQRHRASCTTSDASGSR